jgi:hypothetical protein
MSRRTLPTRLCLLSVATLTLERGLPLAAGGLGEAQTATTPVPAHPWLLPDRRKVVEHLQEWL